MLVFRKILRTNLMDDPKAIDKQFLVAVFVSKLS